ncbi:MAG: fibronectin type III domain-containing protein [Oscillospiraceae bacterium]|nr:fibronectin type III domain-containing protein [Oscillospiraceae bacterium]
MKKRELFKKQIASLLALCMVSNFFIAAGAVDAETFNNSDESETIGVITSQNNPTEETPEETQDTEANTDLSAIGKIDVSVSMALFLDNADFTVALLGSDCESETIHFSADKTGAETISFNHLPDGKYVLEVTGNGFKTYEQEIEVEGGKRYALQLTAGFCAGYSYYEDGDGLHPGVLLIGNADGEGAIDENDKKYLLDLIHEGAQVNDENKSADLNGDDEINIEDLMFFTKGYLEEAGKNTQAHVEKSISPDAVKVSVAENVTIEGSMEDMLNGESEVTFMVDGEVAKNNPIIVGFDVTSDEPVDGISFGVAPETPIAEAVIEVETVDENGNPGITKLPLKSGVRFTTEGEEEEGEDPSPLAEFSPYAEIDSKGNIQVHLGTQVAVKKVSLKVTALAKATGQATNLVTIAKTEFLNGMESRIPEPEVTAPQNVKAVPGSDQFTVTWNPVLNVTGYEVVVKEKDTGVVKKTLSTSATSAMIGDNNHNSSQKLIKNLTTYLVTVQAVNGTWRSTVSETVEVTPMPAGKPDMVNNVKIEGGYRKLTVKWSKMPDTTGYRVYYRLKDSEEPEGMLSTTANSCVIEDLEDKTEYEVYVVGYNDIGDAPKSLVVIERTGAMKASEMSRYGAINLNEDGIPSSNHINAITRNNTSATIEGSEENEVVLADKENNTAWATVDNDPETFYQFEGGNDGGNGLSDGMGLTYEFDQTYNIGSIGFWSITKPSKVTIRWWDENGNEQRLSKMNVSTKKGLNQVDYYSIDIPDSINFNAKKVQFGFSGTSNNIITVNEVVFYKSTDLLKRSKNLFADDLNTVLKDEVTLEYLDGLYAEANTPDEFGNLHPDRDVVNLKLEWAYKIINAKDLGDPILIHNKITTNGPQESNQNRGFRGLNGWQPMGVNVANDEEIIIYVGSNSTENGGREYGGDPELTAIVAQYHTESGNLVLGSFPLKVGENIIRTSKDLKLSQESGGMLYLSYHGGSTNTEKYSIRISGGTKVPILDLYEVKDHETRVEKAATYISELDKYVPNIQKQHTKLHASSTNKFVNKKYDEQNCILGGTEILLDSMLYSLPAQQILQGLGDGSVEERAEKLVASMDATEEMMYLFYQHKGLNTSAEYLSNYERQVKGLNYTPLRHQNIRYMRQFENSFMYATGDHIGIEWGSTAGMVCGKPNFDAEGNYTNNGYFGWGIAHEVGHCLDQGAISMPEITNNYFAELAHGGETNANRRFQYSEVYKKVSSGQKGASSNVATQLALYWQLHIAYDKDPNYTTYSNYNEQLANLFYARLCKICREGKVTLENGTVLNLPSGGDKDQSLMRLACAATQKNVLEFFERWGKEPNQATIDFAKNFDKETRAIFYANDDSRNYVRTKTGAGESSKLADDQTTTAISSVEIAVNSTKKNEVTLKITPNNTVPAEDILGYEIVRCTISGGKTEKSVIGFTQTTEFTDVITSLNNRTVSYEVIMVDQYLNRSAVKTSEMIKIQHEGAVDKSKFQISTKYLTNENLAEHDVLNEGVDETGNKTTSSCDQAVTKDLATLVIDGKSETVYNTTISDQVTYGKGKKGYCEITLDFGEELTIQGFKYTDILNKTAPNTDILYEIFVQTKDGSFTKTPVAAGTIDNDSDGIVYFSYQKENEKKYVCAYPTQKLFIKLYTNAKFDQISIAELDVLTPTGDNVEFRTTTDKSTTLIGTMSADYVYDKEKGYAIPEGSLVFTGKYKGNPAYNVVMLFDENGEQVMGFDETDSSWVAAQTILANVPEGGNITDVADGTWIYWIEPEYLNEMELPEKVRAELYRVDDPITNAGQRLVSDSLFEELTTTNLDELPKMTFGK